MYDSELFGALRLGGCCAGNIRPCPAWGRRVGLLNIETLGEFGMMIGGTTGVTEEITETPSSRREGEATAATAAAAAAAGIRSRSVVRIRSAPQPHGGQSAAGLGSLSGRGGPRRSATWQRAAARRRRASRADARAGGSGFSSSVLSSGYPPPVASSYRSRLGSSRVRALRTSRFAGGRRT